jgi:hypothetical protein
MSDNWSPWRNPSVIPLPRYIEPVQPKTTLIFTTEERLREIIREELDRKGLTTD